MAADPVRRLVIDASVLAKWLLPEPNSAEARSLVRTASLGGVRLSAPAHLLAELTNILWKHAFLLRTITPDEARESVSALETVPISIQSLDALIPEALDLALAHGHSVDDCLYVALALREESDLVTADRALAAAFGPSTGRVVLLADFDPHD